MSVLRRSNPGDVLALVGRVAESGLCHPEALRSASLVSEGGRQGFARCSWDVKTWYVACSVPGPGTLIFADVQGGCGISLGDGSPLLNFRVVPGASGGRLGPPTGPQVRRSLFECS